MSDALDNASCPLCGHVGRMKITTSPPPQFPPLNLNQPLLTLSQCPQCGAVFAKSQAAESLAHEEAVGAY